MDKIIIQPVLVGGDLNCYSVARAYHEAYGVKSIAFGRYELGATKDSNIIDFRVEPKITEEEKFIQVLLDTADELSEPNKKLIIMGCTDEYAELIIDHKDILKDKYIVPYIDKDLKNKLIEKELFYQMCEEYGLDYPKTHIFNKGIEVCDFGFNYKRC